MPCTTPRTRFVRLCANAKVCSLTDVFDRAVLSLQVSTQAKKTGLALTSTLYNPDLKKHLDKLVDAMAAPGAVPSTIKALSSTTFVAEVNAPVLAVMVPLLIRALKERSTETTRMTCIIIANLVKLVRDPKIAATYLGVLVPAVDNIASGHAFPEVRRPHPTNDSRAIFF